MKLPSDRRAVEAIPLRLMIVAVVAAMSVLPAAQALETLKTREFLARASQQLDDIVGTADVLSVEGPGSVRTLSLDFTSSGRVGFASIDVGDLLEGVNSTTIVLRLTNGGTLIRTISNEGIGISTRDGGSLHLSSARFELRMAAQYEGGVLWILAEVL
ncbi:MAG: hypothetical protein A3K60_08815 [Euryarchaeota archaeon RBG_19FT_COMBO_56_21]|nr:MAG: hypothetical protein A3K60_08815 [Euryarchaeota archaeon RBG_19FT_COMBO_56_21]